MANISCLLNCKYENNSSVPGVSGSFCAKRFAVRSLGRNVLGSVVGGFLNFLR